MVFFSISEEAEVVGRWRKYNIFWDKIILVAGYTAVSRKVVGKSARDNPERYCGWFCLPCSPKKFERMAREAMDICSWVLMEQKLVQQLQSLGTVYWSYPILPFGVVACTFFPTTFLEIAVYSGTSVKQPLAGTLKVATWWRLATQ